MSRYRVAVLGANSLVGELLLELLVERRFPAIEIRAFALGVTPGAQVSAGGEDWDLEELAAADLAGFDLLLAAPQTGLESTQLRALAMGERLLIDTGASFRADPQVPLAAALVNDRALAERVPSGLVATPTPLAVALATVLKPLQAHCGLQRVQVSSYQAVSDLGREAVEELAQQTRQLLTFQTMENRVFARQIAFNCLPMTGAGDAQGQGDEEAAVTGELRRLLQQPELPLSLMAVRVPVFYGHGAALTVETQRPFDLTELRAILGAAPGLRLVEDADGAGCPTPVTDASGEDLVSLGRLRRDPSHPQALQLWLVADNLRQGSALNAVRIAESLLLR